MRLIVHGGAGADPDDPADRRAVLDEAAATGADEETPSDAVVAAVSVLERSPRFNAGLGSAVQSDGVVRTDAGIMTDEREIGAACGMPGVRDAVSVARRVMEATPHVLLSGPRTVDFAAAHGIDIDADLLTEGTRARWDELDPPAIEDYAAHLAWVDERFGRDGGSGDTEGVRSHDTVGAVAVENGTAGSDDERIAAATSTGGRWCALAGRVGDVPQVGSGFFCAEIGGASATGAGEDIAETGLSRRAIDRLDAGRNPQAAAEEAIAEFAERTGSEAGVIVADRTGETGSAFNSESMQVSVADAAEQSTGAFSKR
jgi:isoaspartyl peptidase/L-asparaginase-like protein (Ntn-hydrolase superfamily)